MLQSDPVAKELLARYKIPMPNQNLTDDEVKAYIAYFKWADANIQPKGAGQAQTTKPEATRPAGETPSGGNIGAGYK
jgi:nitrite reductase (NO-forming)